MDREGEKITDRLDRMEAELVAIRRENRRLKVAGTGAVVLLLVAWYAVPRPGAGANQRVSIAGRKQAVQGGGTLAVTKLTIVDDKGQVRATLGAEGERYVGLKMFDRGKLKIEQRVWDNGIPGLVCYRTGGGEALAIGGDEHDPGLELYGEDGLARVQFTLLDDSPNLSFHHSQVSTRIQMGIHKTSGVPYFDFFDRADKIIPMLDKAGRPIR